MWYNNTDAEVAQSVVHIHGKDEVAGSIPAFSTMIFVRKDSANQKSLKKFQNMWFLELFFLFFINFHTILSYKNC